MIQEMPEISVRAKKLCPRCVIFAGIVALFLFTGFKNG